MSFSTDFEYNTRFSIETIEQSVRACTPNGMLDLMYLDAASWESTPLHDKYFKQDQSIPEDARPNQFTKWVVELALQPDINFDTIQPGTHL